jgi:hypothetical protein
VLHCGCVILYGFFTVLYCFFVVLYGDGTWLNYGVDLQVIICSYILYAYDVLFASNP